MADPRDKFEEMAQKYIEGIGGLLDMYKYELAIPFCDKPETEGARWILVCLVNHTNRADLDALVKQSDIRIREAK